MSPSSSPTIFSSGSFMAWRQTATNSLGFMANFPILPSLVMEISMGKTSCPWNLVFSSFSHGYWRSGSCFSSIFCSLVISTVRPVEWMPSRLSLTAFRQIIWDISNFISRSLLLPWSRKQPRALLYCSRRRAENCLTMFRRSCSNSFFSMLSFKASFIDLSSLRRETMSRVSWKSAMPHQLSQPELCLMKKPISMKLFFNLISFSWEMPLDSSTFLISDQACWWTVISPHLFWKQLAWEMVISRGVLVLRSRQGLVKRWGVRVVSLMQTFSQPISPNRLRKSQQGRSFSSRSSTVMTACSRMERSWQCLRQAGTNSGQGFSRRAAFSSGGSSGDWSRMRVLSSSSVLGWGLRQRVLGKLPMKSSFFNLANSSIWQAAKVYWLAREEQWWKRAQEAILSSPRRPYRHFSFSSLASRAKSCRVTRALGQMSVLGCEETLQGAPWVKKGRSRATPFLKASSIYSLMAGSMVNSEVGTSSLRSCSIMEGSVMFSTWETLRILFRNLVAQMARWAGRVRGVVEKRKRRARWEKRRVDLGESMGILIMMGLGGEGRHIQRQALYKIEIVAAILGR